MVGAKDSLLRYFTQKRAVAREILGEDTLLREATPDLSSDRSRIDLTLYKKRLGVRGPKKSEDPWDFDFREELSEDLLDLKLIKNISEIREKLPPLEAATLRIRSGFAGEKGLWIEASNLELEKLTTVNHDWIEDRLEEGWIIELGQARFDDFLASDPRCWLPSFSKDNQEIRLRSRIKNFSQPGVEANRALILGGMEIIFEERLESLQSWADLGAGYGNLTAAYSTLWGAPRWLAESDLAVRAGLAWNSENFFPSTLKILGHVETLQSAEKVDLFLADPPRSGFHRYFENLCQRQAVNQPRYILLYSCDFRGLLQDKEALSEAYRLRKWSLVDIFPDTPYAEVISLWEKK